VFFVLRTIRRIIMGYRIFVDSGANIPAILCKKYDIDVLSFVNYVDGKELVCFNPELSALEERLEGEKYYNRIRRGADVKTSLLNQAFFMKAFKPVLEAGEDIICLNISSGISGTYNAARLAGEDLAEQYPDRKIFVIDTKNASLGSGIHAINASIMRSEGRTIEEVVKRINNDIPKMNGLFTVDNLKYLAKTGRVKGAVAVAGNVLNIKPILRGNADGFIVQFDKVRGRRKSLAELCTLFINNIERPENQIVGIAHADAYEEALECAAIIKNNVNVKDVIITSYDFCTGSHVGPETIAVFFLAKDRELTATAGAPKLSLLTNGIA